MVMDQYLRGLSGSIDRFKINDDISSSLSNQDGKFFKSDNTFAYQSYAGIPTLPPDLVPSDSALSLSEGTEGYLHDDYDFSDVVLKYITQMLMEEDMEEKTCMFQESSAVLQAAEKSLYELIGQQYPPLPNNNMAPFVDQNQENTDEYHDLNFNHDNIIGSTSNAKFDWGRNSDWFEHKTTGIVSQSTSQSSSGSANSSGTVVDGIVESPVSTLSVPEIFTNSESVRQFKKGFEEASKFLPNGGSLFIDLGNNGMSIKELKDEGRDAFVKVVKKHEKEHSLDGLRGKKNPHREDVNLESERNNKQSAVCIESNVSSEMFDMVLLNCGESALREALQNGKSKNVQQKGQSKGSKSNGGKSRGKKGGRRSAVDLRTLLTLCAQAVAADDRRNAGELLKQIRQHSSPTGDGMQRMSLYFADGLEARLAGSGTQIYTALVTRPTSAADILKAYHLFLAACPFKKLSNFFSNKTIMNLAENAAKVHIVDFGILYGFPWPCLIQRLSSRPGGPPKLRITGIDLPQPGFRPAERVEETGRRLANYAKTFNIPFEYHAIAQKWDTIRIEDLKIDSDEVLVVTCMHRLRNLLDETVMVESPRDIVLNLIRKMNPDVFIQGIVNGAYSAPFFVTRFREALFHYSTLFDMLETNVPREIPERMLIEREIFGRDAMNVIACEGVERIERPETYKQWQVRNTRAGFKQLPLNEEILKIAKERVDVYYHKDFLIDQDGEWLLQGWKGRIVYALSSWKSDH